MTYICPKSVLDKLRGLVQCQMMLMSATGHRLERREGPLPPKSEKRESALQPSLDNLLRAAGCGDSLKPVIRSAPLSMITLIERLSEKVSATSVSAFSQTSCGIAHINTR
jgi:hypothetical protein